MSGFLRKREKGKDGRREKGLKNNEEREREGRRRERGRGKSNKGEGRKGGGVLHNKS